MIRTCPRWHLEKLVETSDSGSSEASVGPLGCLACRLAPASLEPAAALMSQAAAFSGSEHHPHIHDIPSIPALGVQQGNHILVVRWTQRKNKLLLAGVRDF